MPRWLQSLFAVLIGALLIGAPIVYARFHAKQDRNLVAVREGILYRSGQLSLTTLQRVIRDHGIKTVITFRDAATPGERPPDQDEEDYCRNEAITYYRIKPGRWWTAHGPPPAAEAVRQFLKVMDDPANYPVLMHCFAGCHRTGAFCAIYRIEYQHWTKSRAIAEMKACGYVNFDEEWDILSFFEQYQPRWQTTDRTVPD
jgi:protein tyrosine/serine phosphatase